MKSRHERLLSTAEVAAQLEVSRQRVLELITCGRLPAMKVGRSYVVKAGDVSSLEFFDVGRPPKSKTNGAHKKKDRN